MEADCAALDHLNQNRHLDRGRNASAGVFDQTDEARLPISDYRLHDYRLAGMASITDYDYRRLRLPITITNDYRLRFAAIRLAITISRGPLINTPVLLQGRSLKVLLFWQSSDSLLGSFHCPVMLCGCFLRNELRGAGLNT